MFPTLKDQMKQQPELSLNKLLKEYSTVIVIILHIEISNLKIYYLSIQNQKESKLLILVLLGLLVPSNGNNQILAVSATCLLSALLHKKTTNLMEKSMSGQLDASMVSLSRCKNQSVLMLFIGSLFSQANIVIQSHQIPYKLYTKVLISPFRRLSSGQK